MSARVKNMQMSIENSSLIKHIEWNQNTKSKDNNGTLILTFTNGDQYEYLKVPYDLVNEMIQEESVGSYFCKNIKNQYETYKYMLEDS